MSRAESINSFPTSAGAVLDALPHPVIMVAADGKIACCLNSSPTSEEVCCALTRNRRSESFDVSNN